MLGNEREGSMTIPDESVLLKMEADFKSKHPPDSTTYLEQLRPTLLRFFLDGYSRKLTFEFLKGANLVACSYVTFSRWVKANVDFVAEARKASRDGEVLQPSATAAGEGSGSNQGNPTSLRTADSPRGAPETVEPLNAPEFEPVESTQHADTSTASSSGNAQPAGSANAAALAILDGSLRALQKEDLGVRAQGALRRLEDRDRGKG